MSEQEKKALVSIIIRTKNASLYIKEILSAIAIQEYNNFEIIIVDTGSTDNTLKIIEDWKNSELRIKNLELGIRVEKFLRQPYNSSATLNFGFSIANGDYLVALSHDATPSHSGWLSAFVSAFESTKIRTENNPLPEQDVESPGEIVAVYGKQIPRSDCNPCEARNYLGTFNDIRRIEKRIFLSNANACYKRSIWEKHPFEEVILTAEDFDWAKWANENGYSIIYEPDASVIHSHSYPLSYIFQRGYVEGYDEIRMFGNSKKQSLKDVIMNSLIAIRDDAKYINSNHKNFLWIVYAFLYRFAQGMGRYLGTRKFLYKIFAKSL